MSRSHPFPTRRPKTADNNEDRYTQDTYSSVRPLEINRPPSRPQAQVEPTFSGSQRTYSNASTFNGPSRPRRSQLRSRQESESTARNRDSVSTVRSEASSYRSVPSTYLPPAPTKYSRQERSQTVSTNDSGDIPAALPSVLSAFKNAGNRRRMMSDDDLEYERERVQEAEKERLRQQRIKERTPGRRANGRTRTGDIDGASAGLQFHACN